MLKGLGLGLGNFLQAGLCRVWGLPEAYLNGCWGGIGNGYSLVAQYFGAEYTRLLFKDLDYMTIM